MGEPSDINRIITDLELNHIFVHADEEVYARLTHIIWKHGDIYKKIFIIMGGFHQLHVRQKTLCKRHGYLGYKEWFVDAGIIAPGSVERAFSGYHYYRYLLYIEKSEVRSKNRHEMVHNTLNCWNSEKKV